MFYPLNDDNIARLRQKPPALDLKVITWKNPWWYPPEDLFWDLVDAYTGKKPIRLKEMVQGVGKAIENPDGKLGQLWKETHPLVRLPHLNVIDKMGMARVYTFLRRLPRTELFYKFEELGWSPVDRAIATLALIGFSQKNMTDRMRDLQHRHNIDPFFALLIHILTMSGAVGSSGNGQGQGGGQGQGQGQGQGKGKGQGQGGGKSGQNPVAPLPGKSMSGAGPNAGAAHLDLQFLKLVDTIAKLMREVHLKYKPIEVRTKDLEPVDYPADDVDVRNIENPMEFPMPSELALPDEIFDMKQSLRSLMTYQHYEEKPKSKRFSLLVDVSGSMFMNDRAPFLYAMASAVALVHNTLRGRHEIVLRTFDGAAHPPVRGTPEQVAAYLFTCPASGGGTDIGAAIGTASKHDDPDEIVVISDGDDNKQFPKPKRKNGEEIPVHVIFVTARGQGQWALDNLKDFPIAKNAQSFEVFIPKDQKGDLGGTQ